MSEKLKGFGYEALSEMTEEQWKETVSLWMKEEPNIAISVDLNNDETLMKYEEDGEAGWVYTATSKVGEKQTLQVVCVRDKVYSAYLHIGNDDNVENVRYLEYNCAKQQISYATTNIAEFKSMPSVLAYIASTVGLSSGIKKDILPEFLDISYRFSTNDKTILERCKYADNRDESPIVYVPLNAKGQPLVDADALAKMLCGASHVIVPASRRVMETLKSYGFPYDRITAMNLEGTEDSVTFDPKGVSMFQVSSYVLKKVGNCPPFEFIDAMKKFRAFIDHVGTKNLERLLEESIQMADSQEKKIAELEDEINQLKSKLAYYQEHTSIGKTDESMFKMTEPVIYEGEVKDMLLKLCAKEYDIRKNDPEMRDWRRTYLLKDILDNNEQSGNDEKIITALKDVFTTKGAYVTDTISRAISKFGFEIKKLNGGHNSITLNGDDRLTSVISSTESDNRATKNFLSNYINKLFR